MQVSQACLKIKTDSLKLTIIMMVVNNTLSIAVSRFFAYAFGEIKTDPSKGMEECHRWFSVSMLIHSVISVLLIAIGYPDEKPEQKPRFEDRVKVIR